MIQMTQAHISLSFLSPTDTSRPDGPLMLQDCFTDFAVERWLGCYTFESGYAKDIDATEIILIEWLIDLNLTMISNAYEKFKVNPIVEY